MPDTNNFVMTKIEVYIDEASHNKPSYVYSKQYDSNSRYVKAYLMSAEGQHIIQGSSQMNATKPDGTQVYIQGHTNEDGSATFELTSNLLAVPGTISCDISLFDEVDNSTIILTSSTFYIVVDQSNYNADAIESTDEWNAVSDALSRLSEALEDVEDVKDEAVAAKDDAVDARDSAISSASAAQQAEQDAVAYAEALLSGNISFSLTQNGHLIATVNAPT